MAQISWDAPEFTKHHTSSNVCVSRSITHCLASPIVRIRIKHKVGFVGKIKVKDHHEWQNAGHSQPLQPHGAALTVRGELSERKRKKKKTQPSEMSPPASEEEENRSLSLHNDYSRQTAPPESRKWLPTFVEHSWWIVSGNIYVCLYKAVKDAVQRGWIDRSVLGEQLGVSSCCCALIERYVAADYGFYGAILFFSLSDAGHARCCGRSPLANDRHWPWKIANLCLSMSCPSDDFHHPLALYHILAVKQPLHEKLQWMGPTPKN